jgi:5-methylcytosine-specific restriction endonuclease McrA
VTCKTLVLNRAGTPVSIVKSRRAIGLVNSRKAIVRAVYENTLFRSAGSSGYTAGIARSTNTAISMPIPSVIQCTESTYIPKKYTKVLPFTRQNVYIRDYGHCMYCGCKVSLNSFTFDHVVPQCLGGPTWWTNIVVSCLKCNGEKGQKPVGKYKSPIREPYVPQLDKAAPTQVVSRLAADIQHKTWVDFIYWNVVLIPVFPNLK